MVSSRNERLYAFLLIIGMLLLGSCAEKSVDAERAIEFHTVSASNLTEVLDPELEDIPYFKAIAEEQERQLGVCKEADECRTAHFLRGLAALFENRELAALHFRKVVASRPNSILAGESRFWLWFLDVLNTPNNAGLTAQELIKRLTREVVAKELSIHELSTKIENSSVEDLKVELAFKDELLKKQKQAMMNLTEQLEQGKKDIAIRQEVQQALKASEKKVEELTNQLEALRRIDQEIREKVPPTRPSEKMTPSQDVELPEETQVPMLEDPQSQP